MARVVVAGYMVRHPVAGNVLAYFQYVLGFERLGHEVLYVEESGWPYSCYDPTDGQWHDFPTTGLRVVRELFARYGVSSPICYVNRETGRSEGLSRAALEEWLRSADALVNVGGVCWLPEFDLCPRRALIDLDPFFTQVESFGARILGQYDSLFSYGGNIGRPGCTIPTRGYRWHAMVPPVVLELWDIAPPPPDAPFTTIANWSGYGSIEFEGELYGQKDREFEALIDLPRVTGAPLELAISGASDNVRARFADAGWRVRDAGQEVSRDLDAYRDYLGGSRAEFSAAKHAYVKTRSGWFSDRSACYLAAARPVIVQDTGFGHWLPSGAGVLPFSNAAEAAEQIHLVQEDYQAQASAAREAARAVFAHDIVLPALLDRMDIHPHDVGWQK